MSPCMHKFDQRVHHQSVHIGRMVIHASNATTRKTLEYEPKVHHESMHARNVNFIQLLNVIKGFIISLGISGEL